ARESGGNLGELKAELQSAGSNFQEKLEEVDARLQSVAKEWDTTVEANADAAARKKLFARMNDLLNRRSYIRNLVAGVEKELAAASLRSPNAPSTLSNV